jgi:carboxymethylenebutenolidase
MADARMCMWLDLSAIPIGCGLLLAHFVDEDTRIPVSAVDAFKAAQPRGLVQLYRAHHGFNCDHRGAWHAAVAALARERTLAFLARWVG